MQPQRKPLNKQSGHQSKPCVGVQVPQFRQLPLAVVGFSYVVTIATQNSGRAWVTQLHAQSVVDLVQSTLQRQTLLSLHLKSNVVY